MLESFKPNDKSKLLKMGEPNRILLIPLSGSTHTAFLFSEAPRERPRLQLAKRTVPKEEDSAAPAPASNQSSIFGGAKPVDTAKKEKEIEEKLEKTRLKVQDQRSERSSSADKDRSGDDDEETLEKEKEKEPEKERPAPKKPSAASIFGQAKPVDTAAREKEIEERLRKRKEEEEKEEKGKIDEQEGEKRPTSPAGSHPTRGTTGNRAGPPRSDHNRDRDQNKAADRDHNRNTNRDKSNRATPPTKSPPPPKGEQEQDHQPVMKKFEEAKPPVNTRKFYSFYNDNFHCTCALRNSGWCPFSELCGLKQVLHARRRRCQRERPRLGLEWEELQ